MKKNKKKKGKLIITGPEKNIKKIIKDIIDSILTLM